MIPFEKHRYHDENDGEGGGDGGAGGDGGDGKGDVALSEDQLKFVQSHGFTEDWRTHLAGDDEKLQKRLERFAEPKAIVNWGLSAEQKFKELSEQKSGPLARPADLDEDATKAWLKENNLPETAEAYLENLPEGLVIGEDDKDIVLTFAKRMHDLNAHPSTVHAAIGWYNDYKQAEIDNLAENDERASTATEEALRAEWGKDYKPNVKRVQALLDARFDEEDVEVIMSARGSDGTAILNRPSVMQALMSLAREVNDSPTLPVGGSDMKSMEDRINELKGLMGNKNSEYWKGAKADGLQNEYRQLIEQRDKVKARNKAA